MRSVIAIALLALIPSNALAFEWTAGVMYEGKTRDYKDIKGGSYNVSLPKELKEQVKCAVHVRSVGADTSVITCDQGGVRTSTMLTCEPGGFTTANLVLWKATQKQFIIMLSCDDRKTKPVGASPCQGIYCSF
jgi:hypothetical protein